MKQICTWFMRDLHYQCFEMEQPKTQRELVRHLSGIRLYRQKLSLLYAPEARH